MRVELYDDEEGVIYTSGEIKIRNLSGPVTDEDYFEEARNEAVEDGAMSAEQARELKGRLIP